MLIYTFQWAILNPYLLCVLSETGKACQTTIISLPKTHARAPYMGAKTESPA